MKLRPNTPLIRITNPPSQLKSSFTSSSNPKEQIEIKTTSNNKDYLLKNFQTFMKNIINDQNQTFLSGSKNIIKYILSQYLQIPESELNSLQKLSILISNDYGLLNQFGVHLPNLKLLKLNNSNLLSFNDIGTNFNSVQCLQMRNCHLKDLNGLVCMQHLQILDIEQNYVDDLIDIEMCSELKKLNLKNNLIANYENIEFISYIEKLDFVCLVNNPITDKGKNDEGFKMKVRKELNRVEKVILYDEDGICDDIVKEFDDNNICIEKDIEHMNNECVNKNDNHSKDISENNYEEITEMIKGDVLHNNKDKGCLQLKEIENKSAKSNDEEKTNENNIKGNCNNNNHSRNVQKPNIEGLMRSHQFKTSKIQIDASNVFDNKNGTARLEQKNDLIQESFNKTARAPFRVYLKNNNDIHLVNSEVTKNNKLCDSTRTPIKTEKNNLLNPISLFNSDNHKESISHKININSNREINKVHSSKDKPVLLLGNKNTINNNNKNSLLQLQQPSGKKVKLMLGKSTNNN